jgi:alcohol dehydrogenase
VILVTDQGIKASGLADTVEQLLVSGGLEVVVYDQVQADPSDAEAEAIGQVAREFGAEAVVGLGGGSSLDSAKMTGILIANPDKKIADYYLTVVMGPEGPTPAAFAPMAPVILAPTTSGSGSELSAVAVVSHHEDHQKDAVFASAVAVILDPALTVGGPPHVTAFAGLDVLAHALEAFTSASADPQSKVLALEAIRLVGENLKPVYDNGKDIDARANMAIASNFAGQAFNNTGLHFGHSFGHELGGVYHLPHGMASSYAIPVVIKFTAEHDPERAAQIAGALKVADADAAIAFTLDLMRHCGIPSFAEKGISAEDAAALAEGAIAHNVFFHNTVVPISTDEFKDIIRDIVNTYDQYSQA